MSRNAATIVPLFRSFCNLLLTAFRLTDGLDELFVEASPKLIYGCLSAFGRSAPTVDDPGSDCVSKEAICLLH